MTPYQKQMSYRNAIKDEMKFEEPQSTKYNELLQILNSIDTKMPPPGKR